MTAQLTESAIVAGRKLHKYLQYRGEREDQPYELTPAYFADYFAEHFGKGVRSLFGVVVNDEGQIVTDEREPEIFQDWRKGR
jgi:hypothetical protein